MKSIFIFSLALALGAGAAEEKPAPKMPAEVTLTSGRVLRNVQVVRWESARVVLKHAAGVDPVPFSVVAEPLRSRLPLIREAHATTPPSPTKTERTIEGQIFYVAGGNSRAPKMAGIEVRLYLHDTLRAYENSRAMPIGHERLLPIAGTLMTMPPNPRAIEDYMQNEYASWDGLPEPLAKTHTDLEGRFSIKAPGGAGDVVLFARSRLRSSYLRGGSREFAYVWVVKPNPEGATIMGNEQVHPGIAKALAIFR